MYNPEDDVLQEIQSSDSEEDISTRSKSQAKEIRELLSDMPLYLRGQEEQEEADVHVKLSQLHEIISDDEGDDITSPIGSPPADISALGGRDKFMQLRRKLEEDQAKTFESVQPIQVTDVETLLESFRSERDQSRSSSTRIEANPKFLELYQQVKDRDHRILDLETKLMEQNRKVVDLEDNLSEKEKLLSSKNEAVSVVQQKFEAELRLKKEELEKSQRLLFELERNLGKVQDQWKEDKDRFNSDLQKQEEKYQKLLDSNKSLESTRFQLTTQMAELQEQLVHLQKSNSTLLSEKATLESSNKEHSEKFIADQQEFEKAKEQLDFDQELLEREKEILERDLKSLEDSKNSFSTEFEEFQLQKSIFQEESLALTEEKIAVSREREIIDTEKEAFYADKEAFETEKETFETEKERIAADYKQQLEEKDRKIQELTESVEKLQANLKKLKVQFQTKLKALKEEKAKEREKETEDQSISVAPELEAKLAEQLARIEELVNKVTELEEEKGNLLLRLVDFDEHQDLHQLKENLSSTEISLEEKARSLTELQFTLEHERENLSIQKQSLDSSLAQLSSDQNSVETLKEQLSHQQESLEKEQETLRTQQENLELEKACLMELQLLLETSRGKLKVDENTLQEEKSSFNKERENENLSLNFEREALRSQREAFQQEQEILRLEREELTKAQEELLTEKETLRTDKQGLAMERETWQWQSQEAEDLRTNLQKPDVSCESLDQQLLLDLQGKIQQQATTIQEQAAKIEEQASKIKQLTDEAQELKEQLETARNNVKKLKLQFQAKLKQIREKAAGGVSLDSEKLTELQNKVAELEEEKGQLLLRLVDFEELQATHEALMTKLASMDQQVKANDAKIRSLEAGREQFQEIPLSFEPIVTTREHQLDSAFTTQFSDPFSDQDIPPPLEDDQVRTLTKQVEILEQSLQTKAKRILSLEDEIKSLEEQIQFNREDFSSAVADFDRAINKKNDDHQIALDSLEKQVHDKQQEIDNLKQMLDELEQFTEDQGQRETKSKGEASENRKIQDKEHLENQELLESQEEKQIEILRLTGENADLYRQLEDTTHSLSERERELTSIQAKLADLTTEFNSKKSAEEENLHELLELQEVKENLEKSLEASTQEVQRLSDFNVKLENQIAQVSESLQGASSDYRKIQSSAAEVPVLQTEIERLTHELALLRDVEAHLKTEVSTLKEQLLEKDEEFDTTGKELTDLRIKVEELTAEILTQHAALEPLQAEIMSLKNQLVEKDEELEFTNDQIMSLSVKSGQAEKFEKALLEAQQELSNKCFEVDRLNSELSLAQASLEKEVSSRDEHIKKMAELQKSLETAQARIMRVEEEYGNLNEQAEALHEEILNRNILLEQKQGEQNRLSSEIERLNDELKNITERAGSVNTLEAKLQIIEEENFSLAQTLQAAEIALKDKEAAIQMKENALKETNKVMKEAVAAKEAAILELVQTQADFDEVLRKQLESAIAHALQEKEAIVAHSLGEKDQDIYKLRNQVSDLEKMLESANLELKGKEMELEFTREEMAKLTEALNHVEKVVLKEVQEKEDQMKIQVLELTTLVNEKDQEIKKIMADYDEYYNQARLGLDAKSKQLEILEQSLFEKNETLTKVEENLRELKERHQAEIFGAIEKHNEEEESLFARIGALTEENSQLKSQVSKITEQIQELNRQQFNPVITESIQQTSAAPLQGALQQPPIPNPFQHFQNQSAGDFFDNLPAANAQERPPDSVLDSNPEAAQVSAQQQQLLAEKENLIYEQSVQITELEITTDELRAQLSEITELKMELEVLQHQNFGLTTEVQSLQKQINTLQSERKHKIEHFLDMEAISGPKSSTPSPAPSSQPAEEPVVRATAYVTTDQDPTQAALLDAKEAQINSLSAELRELKVKSGRVLQKLRQTTNRYEELQKAHQALKTKSEFTLESALEGEISDQLKKKDAIIAEKTKQIQEIQAERVKLQNQVDVFERANDKLTEGKENQDRMLETLVQQKKSLEQEVQGLKWKLEEVEDGASFNNVPDNAQPDTLTLENNSLRIQNAALVQEIDNLQQQVNYQRQIVANLQYQLEQVVYSQGQVQLQQLPTVQTDTMGNQHLEHQAFQSESVQPLQSSVLSETGQLPQHPTPSQDQLQQLAEEEIVERAILERKIELLQNKISELETNETRYYDELQKTKSHAQMLDMENLTNQEIILDLNRRLNSTERDNLKSKILQEEVNRLILILDEKDNVKCDQVTSEIIRLQEEKAVLEYQLAVSTQQQQLLIPAEPRQLDSLLDLREKLAELERRNIMLEIDLRREINARRIVQEQLFFKQAAKSQNHRLGMLVGNPLSSPASSSPSRGSPMPSPAPSTTSHSPRVATPDSSPKLPL